MNDNTESQGKQEKAVGVEPGVSMLMVVLIAAAFSLFSGFLSWHFATSRGANSPFVLVDSAKIAGAKMKSVLASPDFNEAKAAEEGRRFAEKMNGVLATYTARGVIVVNAALVVNRPDGLDVTRDVAAAMGVELDK